MNLEKHTPHMMGLNFIPQVESWMATSGQMPQAPAPDARQSAFYLGMQLEEMAEKLAAVMGEDNWLASHMREAGEEFKRGAHDADVRAVMDNSGDVKDMLDADIDILWVTIGAARAQGANVPLAAGLVAQANWAKFPGGVIERHPVTGKVVKPAGWVAPDLAPALHINFRPRDGAMDADDHAHMV